MQKFIPKNKLGRKAHRQLDSRQRAVWGFSPVTRKAESKKHYQRHRDSREFQKDWNRGSFSCFEAGLKPLAVR